MFRTNRSVHTALSCNNGLRLDSRSDESNHTYHKSVCGAFDRDGESNTLKFKVELVELADADLSTTPPTVVWRNKSGNKYWLIRQNAITETKPELALCRFGDALRIPIISYLLTAQTIPEILQQVLSLAVGSIPDLLAVETLYVLLGDKVQRHEDGRLRIFLGQAVEKRSR